MFERFKKKKDDFNKNGVLSTTPPSIEEQKPVRTKKIFSPQFGTAESFTNAYMQGDEHVTIGRCGEETVGVTAIGPPADHIVILNNDQDSVTRQCVLPTVLQGKLSYIVYDPDGIYHEHLAGRMRLRGYDIQLVDLADEEHLSRVDLFEIANITKNPYWVSVILSGSMKCNRQEIPASHNLLMAMMQYLLAKKDKIYINDVAALLDKIISIDTTVLRDMRECPASKAMIENVAKVDHQLLLKTAQKIKKHFLDGAVNKVKNPNIFTITAHKKQTITFIKRVPSKYKYLTTAMLFNLKASSIVCGAGNVSTLIIDTSSDDWYNRALLAKVTAESGSAMDQGVGYMAIRPTTSEIFDSGKPKIIVYMHSDDKVTKECICDYLKIGGVATNIREDGLSQFFKGKDAAAGSINTSTIDIAKLENLKDCIVVDTSGLIRPFRCDRLA